MDYNQNEELLVLRHALGLKDDGNGKSYRNYYAAEPNDPVCKALAVKGDMERRPVHAWGDLLYYRVTEQGVKRARQK